MCMCVCLCVSVVEAVISFLKLKAQSSVDRRGVEGVRNMEMTGQKGGGAGPSTF